MNEEAIKLLYEDIKDSYDVGSLDDFKNYLLDDNKRQMFFDQVIKPKYDVSTIGDFESVYGLKKKDKLQPTSQEVVMESTIKEEETPTSLESSKSKLNYKEFLLKTEEEAKPILEDKLKGRDFTVEETGIGNALNVKDNVTGETIEIDLRPAPITGNTMEQQYEKLDMLFSPEYEKKRRSIDYGKLLEESGYLKANRRDGSYMTVTDEDLKEKIKDNHLFINEKGESVIKKSKDLSPELLTAINLYEEANKKRNTSIYAGNVDINTRKDEEVIDSDDVPDEYISTLGIDKDDYLKWVNKNRRKESVLYKAVKYLFTGDEGEEYLKEKKQYEKIKSYKASILNDIASDISTIDSRIKLSKDQSLKNNLKREREILQKEFLKNANQMNSAINLFPKYKEYTLNKDLERRKNLYYASRSGEKINATAQGIEIGKTAFSAIHNFATGFFSLAGEMPDELLFNAGFEDKGFFKGLSEVLTDASEAMDASFGPVQRRTVTEGKTVFYKNQEYIVDKNGSVLDSKTNVSVEGIISDDDIKEIIKRSKNIKDTDLNLTVGSGLQGTTQTLANLVALIRTGGKTTKALGLKGSKAGAYGMGIASYMSSVTSSVEDIRSQLVESGMSEQEALDVSISAGNAIASLDGIFSGLAGSNAKLMSGLSGIKQEIINAAKTKGKEFSSKQFKDKAYELLKENARELFIEELPVLFSEKGINYLVNEHIGKEVLDDDINRGDIVETAILTIAATSTLGSTNLLSGNNRKDFIRGLAKDNNINLEATLNKMVLDEQITKDQAYNVYKEVSSMREADLKTSETIFMSENVEEAADLIKQKELLKEKSKDLDGALKEDIDKKIASIDEQIKQLREKDKESAKKEYDAIQEQKTGDIPDAKPAEGVQEVETEVREPAVEETEEDITFDINEKFDTEEKILNEIPSEKNVFYHGSPDIEWTTEKDIDVESNTRNAKSKYIFLAEKPVTALRYSEESVGRSTKITPKSGIASFEIKKGAKTYKLTKKDIDGAVTIESLEAVYDKIKQNGYDVVINTLDGNNRIILNNNIIQYKNTYKNQDALKPKVTPEATNGVSKLRDAFNKKGLGSKKPNTPAQKVNIEDQAIKAKQSISKLFPNVEIEVYYNENDYHKAIGEVDQSGGTYFNNKVYINLTRATDTTVAHEVFHAVLSQSLKSDTEIQNLTKKFVDSLINGNDKDVIQALADKVSTIEQYKDVANEEIMAELFGVLAGFGKKLKPKTRSLVKRFLDRVAKILGLKKFTDNELIDVLNTLSKKVALGESIEAADIGIFKGGKVVDNPSQAISKKSVGLFDVQYTEDNRRNELIDKGLLVEVNDVSGFSGLQATITSPDDMLAGTISIDGKQIFEGGGGIFFVTKYGDVWASGKKGTANTLAKMINDSLKNNGDRGLLVLAKGADQKLISSVSGVNSSLAILDVMLDKGLISPSDFRSAVSGAVKAAGGIISLSGSAKQLKSDINKYFSDPNTTTFEKRGNVVKDLIGRLAQSKSVKDNSTEIIELLGGDPNKNLAKGSTKLSQSLGDLVAGVAAEQLTKGLSVGDVYGIIEVNSEVEVIEDSHPSYPFHIRLKDGSSPKLILPKNRQNGSEVLKTSTGKVYRVGNVSVLSGSFNPDIKPKKQVSGKPSIDEVRKFAKENNISNADTNAYLKELGYTDKEIFITVTEIRERSEASIKAKKKKDASIATRTREKLLDRQARIKGLLKGIDSKESKQAVAKIVTKAGAGGYASFRFKEAEDKIYKGLSNEDSKNLDEIIYASRIVSINKNRAERGLDPYTGIEGYNEVSAQRDLDDKKQKLGDKKFKELKKRSDIYFTEFNKSLKRMFDSGLISEEVYNQLKDLDYSPIKTIKYIIPENSSSEEIDRVAISAGVTRDAIKNLGDSNINDIITDTKWLLATNLSMIEAKIFENRMLNAFEDAINSATETEKIALNEYILDNPVVGKYKDGRPKRKYDDKYDNINYTKVYYKRDGVDKYFVMKKIYAEQLLDVKMKQSEASDVISKLTGTQVLRFFATSGNPLFIVGNTAVDFNNILFLSDTYSNFKLLGGAELAYDFTKNSLGKVFASESYTKSYNEFMEHGGSIDYLSVDGLKALQNLDTGMKPIKKATDILKSYGKVLSYLGETSEISFRIAVYEKSKSNQLKKLGRKPTEQEMEDIMFEAAREARETIDFSQGGSATKAADKTLPYLNAATQGLRKGLDYANNNPAGFASSMLQAALMSGGLMAGSLMMLLSGLDDEDEIDEVLGRISEYEKSNYHIIFTGDKDDDGEYEYYRVKKLPTISVFSTLAEQLVTKAVLKSRGVDYDVDGDVMEKSLKSAMPIVPTPKEFLQRNPLLSSVVTYSTNYDFFYDKPIFQGPRGKKIAPSAEGLYDPKINQIYKDWGQATGMSPARSKAAFEKIITSESTNPVVGLIYSGYDAAFKDDTAISEDFNNAKESLFKNVSKKLKRKTNKNLKVYNERAKIEEQEMIIETEIYNKEQKVYRQIVSKHKNNEELTNNELKNIVKENFDKKDWKKYYRKYYIMNKKKDVDRGLLDILYESTPEVQALKLFKRFGNSLDADEYKELKKVSKAARRNLSKKAYKIYKDKYTK